MDDDHDPDAGGGMEKHDYKNFPPSQQFFNSQSEKGAHHHHQQDLYHHKSYIPTLPT